MFFLRDIEHTVTLEPRFLDAGLRDHVRVALYRQLEGSCSGRHGHVVAVAAVEAVAPGVVSDAAPGATAFRVKCRALVMKLYRGEVVDARVATANKMGFFAAVGPLEVFVSSHQMPHDFRFEPNAAPPCYVSETSRIAPGDAVRLRIVGTRVDAAKIFAIGSMNDDGLGLISAP